MRATLIPLLLLALTSSAVGQSASRGPETHFHSDLLGVSDDHRSLDIYADGRPPGSPVVVFVHGGGWVSGHKSSVQRAPRFLEFFEQRDIVLVSLGIRLVSEGRLAEVSFREQAADIAAGLKWVHDNIHRHRGDPGNVVLFGFSAGAHLVSLVATDPQYLRGHGLEPEFLRGVIALDVNAYDIPQAIADAAALGVPISAEALPRIFTADTKIQEEASPIQHVSTGRSYPPFLIVYAGIFDTSPQGVFHQTLSKVQSEQFSRVLHDASAVAVVYGDLSQSHRGIMRDFGRSDDGITSSIDMFLRGLQK